MNPTGVAASRLENRTERHHAELAARATLDTIHGGAWAMVLARRLSLEAEAIVSDVYSASTGTTSEEHGAWECGECGWVHLGIDAAGECCTDEPIDHILEARGIRS